MEALQQINFQHERFALEYVRTRNATTAYGIAYPDAELSTCGSRGCELLKDALIQRLVERYREMLRETFGLDARSVIEEMKSIAFSNVMDVVEVGEEGDVNLRRGSEIPEAARAAISEISTTKDGVVKVRMHSKLDALKSLGTHLGLFQEKVDVKVSVTHDLTEVAKRALDRVRELKREENAVEITEGELSNG